MKFQRKPEWIKVRLPGGEAFDEISSLLRERDLNTVCEEARCPNIAECWDGGTATLMLMGDICTRGCRFCAVTTGSGLAPLDPFEPRKSAETVELMRLKYVVLTSVNRDDLPDGGAGHFARTIHAIHQRTPKVLVECLVPDFQGLRTSVERIIESKPEVFAHNLETVERLTPHVRDQRATYKQSLYVLQAAKKLKPTQFTKSSIMLGLGENRAELRRAFKDLRSVGVDFLTLGQYLQPTKKHLKVLHFLTPDEFTDLQKEALGFGFKYVASGPLVRSSYRAGEFFIASIVRQAEKRKDIVTLPHASKELPQHV